MIVGLTGGIGSGKTTAGSIFRQLGIPVYLADDRAKSLMHQDEDLRLALRSLLGGEIVPDQGLDRAAMARVIFGDQDLLDQVNALVHPAVKADFQSWYSRQQSPYVIREAAILFESGAYRDCEKIILVTAPRELRIQRVMDRNGETREGVESRMKRQWPEEDKISRADYLLNNDQNHMLIPQILHIHEDLIRRANSGSR